MTTEQRPRILIVTRNLPPLVGGMERLNWHLAEELPKVAEVPMRAARVSKRHIRSMRDGLRFLLSIFKFATLYAPVKLFVPTTVAFFVLGWAYWARTFLALHRLSRSA